jgi:hypothetical protein
MFGRHPEPYEIVAATAVGRFFQRFGVFAAMAGSLFLLIQFTVLRNPESTLLGTLSLVLYVGGVFGVGCGFMFGLVGTMFLIWRRQFPTTTSNSSIEPPTDRSHD